MTSHNDTLILAKELVACRSLTPDDDGALALIERRLSNAGFLCERIERGGVSNLWAQVGTSAPLVCLAGHVDVVPPGPLDQWASDPFTPTEHGGFLVGRGSADMKASVAAMVTAAERVATDLRGAGAIAVLLTSDEEGEALHGTAAVVDYLLSRGQRIDFCLIGEPTSSERFGDTLKNGRRGSLNGVLRVHGVQCHIAYPERGRSPIHDALPALAELVATEWDQGNEYFPPSSFQISNVHAGTGANNVIPGALDLLFNFRFSTESSVEGLKARVHEVLDRHQVRYDLTWSVSGEPFLTPKGRLVDALAASIARITGVTPELSTSGGTSDGRFLAAVAEEVAEFGPLNDTIHKVNERVAIADLGPLSEIYEQTIRTLLRGPHALGSGAEA
ncbi:MAG: succinyl-diaminopimelate desuccinylase [Vicinamibacterales bacterium]